MKRSGTCYFIGDDEELWIGVSYNFESGWVRSAWIKIVNSPEDDTRDPFESEWVTPEEPVATEPINEKGFTEEISDEA